MDYEVLHEFAIPSIPNGNLLVGTDGSVYGTTSSGGASDKGTVFRLDATGGFTTLHSFSGADGANPRAELIQASDGNFYGTTQYGGKNAGTVFKMTPTGTVTTLHSFSGGNDGGEPWAALIQASDGNFYGTTFGSGICSPSCGTVFKLAPTGTLTTLYSFTGGTDGGRPMAALIQASDGNIYGTTSWYGVCVPSCGTVFRLTPSGAFTTLYHFLAGTDGAGPSGVVEGTDGNLYGTTQSFGGSGYGTVFKLTPSGLLTTLHAFSGADGGSPWSVSQGSDGNLYGTTIGFLDSPPYMCTIFKLTPTGSHVTLHTFDVADGATPHAGLFRATDGNLYGTTLSGGPDGVGTVFKLTPSGTFTTLYGFSGSDGGRSEGGVIQGTDGDFYGTTTVGGDKSSGTVFKLTSSGTVTRLHAFSGPDGATPKSALLQASDGSFYGTTDYGGAYGYGTVFKMTPSGILTTLREFDGANGAYPIAPLLQGTDGALYGTTLGGGPYNDAGTVFKLTLSGNLTTLHAFRETDGARPMSGLLQGTDGNLYGTTLIGGYGYGTVFRMRPSGTLTTLHSFRRTDGNQPSSGVINGPDGDIYGTTLLDGPFGKGTVFKLTPSGTLTTVHAFTGADGASPSGNLVRGTGGIVSGTTAFGGGSGGGVAFALRIRYPLTVSLAGTGLGTVMSDPVGIECGATCALEFDAGAVISLTATPGSGFVFTGWNGGCTGSSVTCTVTMNAARDLTATFQDLSPPTITHTPVTSWAASSPIPVTATITDNMALQGPKLFYRRKGAADYSAATMTRSGSIYRATIPASPMTSADVQYYLEAWDAAGNVARVPNTAPGTPFSVVVGGTTVFTDDPLSPRTSSIKALHFTELRDAINTLRVRYGLAAFAWTGATPASGGAVRASHLTDLRTALAQAYQAAERTPPTYTGTIATRETAIKASHLSELRTSVRALESGRRWHSSDRQRPIETSWGIRRKPAAAECESKAKAWRMCCCPMSAKLVASTKLRGVISAAVEDFVGLSCQIFGDERIPDHNSTALPPLTIARYASWRRRISRRHGMIWGRSLALDSDRVWGYGAGMVKLTFTFDQETVDRLRQAASRLGRPQSYVVREAVREYAERIGTLSEQERRTLLKVFDTVIPAIPPRPLSQVRAEIAAVRTARRQGGRTRRTATR